VLHIAPGQCLRPRQEQHGEPAWFAIFSRGRGGKKKRDDVFVEDVVSSFCNGGRERPATAIVSTSLPQKKEKKKAIR